MRSQRIVIVGGGIAGAATAWELARRDGCDVVVLDRERQPGAHSTGRNAAILRTAIPDPVLHALAAESADFYGDPPAGFAEHPLVHAVGLLLAARDEHADALRAWMGDARCCRGGREEDPALLMRAHPYAADRAAALWSFPDEGVVDVHGILAAYLRGARARGAALRLNCDARGLLFDGDRVTGVRTADGDLEADAVVFAGGGWAGTLAARSDLPLPLQPTRRHLLVTAPDRRIAPNAPVAWILGDEFYFRPESGGLMLSACDEVAVEPDEGERVDASVQELFARKAEAWLPGLDAGVAHLWAGVRTFAPDRRFVVGPDPRVEGLHWAAGLGGHGITCGPAVGRLAADWVRGEEPSGEAAAALLPARLLNPSPRAAPARATAFRQD